MSLPTQIKEIVLTNGLIYNAIVTAVSYHLVPREAVR